MSGDNVKEHERKKIGGLLGAAIANIVPQSMREDFMANYNCKPPPIFMIFISIVEVYNWIPHPCIIMIHLSTVEVIFTPSHVCMYFFFKFSSDGILYQLETPISARANEWPEGWYWSRAQIQGAIWKRICLLFYFMDAWHFCYWSLFIIEIM